MYSSARGEVSTRSNRPQSDRLNVEFLTLLPLALAWAIPEVWDSHTGIFWPKLLFAVTRMPALGAGRFLNDACGFSDVDLHLYCFLPDAQ